MHTDLPKVYYFINKFDKNNINKLNKNIALIYRNYNEKLNKRLIIQIKKYCKLQKRKFFLSNNFKLAFKLGLDGVYLPSFNNDLKHINFPKKKNFLIGLDTITPIKLNSKKILYNIRFHLMPHCQTQLTNSKKKVIIKTKNQNTWVFESENDLTIDESIFIDLNDKIQQSKQIVINGFVGDSIRVINWSIKEL